jgi:hypothetical protein
VLFISEMEQKCHVGLCVNIGFIGAGNMAKAIGEGLTHAGNKTAS